MYSIPRHQRPEWWNAEKVLQILKTGERPGSLCARASEETGGQASPELLRRDISVWSQSTEWGDQFQAALALWKPKRDGSADVSTDWHDEFFECLAEADGDVDAAARAAGVGIELVYAMRDKRNKVYSAEFDERCRIGENKRFAKVRRNLIERALDPTPDGGRLAKSVLANAMPNLHGNEQHVKVDGKLAVDHKHQFELPADVLAASQARMRALLGKRERAVLPAPRQTVDVMDVVPVEEDARA